MRHLKCTWSGEKWKYGKGRKISRLYLTPWAVFVITAILQAAFPGAFRQTTHPHTHTYTHTHTHARARAHTRTHSVRLEMSTLISQHKQTCWWNRTTYLCSKLQSLKQSVPYYTSRYLKGMYKFLSYIPTFCLVCDYMHFLCPSPSAGKNCCFLEFIPFCGGPHITVVYCPFINKTYSENEQTEKGL